MLRPIDAWPVPSSDDSLDVDPLIQPSSPAAPTSGTMQSTEASRGRRSKSPTNSNTPSRASQRPAIGGEAQRIRAYLEDNQTIFDSRAHVAHGTSTAVGQRGDEDQYYAQPYAYTGGEQPRSTYWPRSTSSPLPPAPSYAVGGVSTLGAQLEEQTYHANVVAFTGPSGNVENATPVIGVPSADHPERPMSSSESMKYYQHSAATESGCMRAATSDPYLSPETDDQGVSIGPAPPYPETSGLPSHITGSPAVNILEWYQRIATRELSHRPHAPSESTSTSVESVSFHTRTQPGDIVAPRPRPASTQIIDVSGREGAPFIDVPQLNEERDDSARPRANEATILVSPRHSSSSSVSTPSPPSKPSSTEETNPSSSSQITSSYAHPPRYVGWDDYRQMKEQHSIGRLRLWHETTEASFEEKLMAGGYPTFDSNPPPSSDQQDQSQAQGMRLLEQSEVRLLDSVQRRYMEQCAALEPRRPNEHEDRKRKRLAAFDRPSTSATRSRLIPRFIPGKGMVLLDESITSLADLLSPDPVEEGSSPTKKRLRRHRHLGPRYMNTHGIRPFDPPESPNWVDDEFPWSLRRDEHSKQVEQDKEMRMKAIERFLECDDGEEEPCCSSDDESATENETLSTRVSHPHPVASILQARAYDQSVGRDVPTVRGYSDPGSIPAAILLATPESRCASLLPNPADAKDVLIQKLALKTRRLRKPGMRPEESDLDLAGSEEEGEARLSYARAWQERVARRDGYRRDYRRSVSHSGISDLLEAAMYV